MTSPANSVSTAKIFARPAPDDIWLGPAQRDAMVHLFSEAPYKSLDGPPSCGKTTLLRHARSLHPAAVVLLLAGPRRDAADVLTGLLLGADLVPGELGETDLRNLLTVFLQQRRSQRKRILLLVDNAHRFAPEACREIERLCLLEDAEGPLLELVAAMPAGARPPFAIGAAPAAHSMPELGAEELRNYLEWRFGRLELPFPFSDGALRAVEQLSEGRYGAVDALCHMAVMLDGEVGARIDERAIRNAARALAKRRGESDPGRLGPQPARTGRKQAGAASRGRLVVMHEDEVLKTVPLGKGLLLLGRSLRNDISLASSAVSRFHAAVVATADKFFLVDLQSTNGVLLNGMPVGTVDLCDQDVVTIGPFHLKLVFEQRPAETADGAIEDLEDTAKMAQSRRDVRPIRLVK